MASSQRPGNLVGVVLGAVVALALAALCHGSHNPRRDRISSILRPMLLLESNQAQGARQGVEDDAALMELDQLLNLLQASKGKRSQDLADKVLQPGGPGMWFGPRLGRRRKRSASLAQLQDADVDNDIPWKLAELLRELQGPKRSPAPCDQSEINCLLASIANGAGGIVPADQEQRPRSEGNLVNFTPRLGRESGEQTEEADAGPRGSMGMGASRQLRTEGEPVWGFSPRLGRRLLPPGTMDVHAPAARPPSGRSTRSADQPQDAAKTTKGMVDEDHA